MKTPFLPNFHVIEVKYRGATNFQGSKIVLKSLRFENDRLIDGCNNDYNSIKDQAEVMLSALGYNVIGAAEFPDGMLMITSTFEPLKEQAKKFKAALKAAKA